ncbi:MAG: 16S rRNA (cytosine(1402)-N(4))-methyltransferase RsmH [Acidobacteriota bacterium]
MEDADREERGAGSAAHEPVLVDEVLRLLAPRRGGLYVDGTVGLGGHAASVLEASSPDGRLVGLDRDAESLALAAHALARFGERVVLIHADYRQGPDGVRLPASPLPPYDGVLLDLGLSSMHLMEPERGFSFKAPGPLDMRFDRRAGLSLRDMLAYVKEGELADIIYKYGEERESRRIARNIKEAWSRGEIETTADLAAVVGKAVRRWPRSIHPATRTFQALRIWVNGELDGLGPALRAWSRGLSEGGRLLVISFHSLEDRIVKQSLRQLVPEGFLLLTPHPVAAGEAERSRNRRARSAKLRAVERQAVAS